MKLKDIKPNPNNPRLIKDAKFAKLVKSIKDFPKMMELRPIIIDDNNIVLGGNMRLKALKELKYKDIPDTWTKSAKDLTEEETRRFIIADNIGFGEHDWDILANEWDAKELEEWGLEGFPFEDEVLEAEEDDYTEPENMKVDVVLGDLIEIGEHRLLCGSSTEMDTWQKVMGDELCDLVITDPPYNVAYVGKTKEALTMPVGTATTPIPIKEINVPNSLPPKVFGNISSKPTPVNDDTAHQKDSVILEKALGCSGFSK